MILSENMIFGTRKMFHAQITHVFYVYIYSCHHLIRVIIGSAVKTKALPAGCLRFQRVEPLSIFNIDIFFCKKRTFLVVFLHIKQQ